MARRHATGTIVAHNYVAQARVLARSFQTHNPDHAFYTLIVDGSEEDRKLGGLGTVVLPSELPIPVNDLNAMRAMYTVMEYSTALKPAFLLFLHHSHARTATYLDPDIRVYGELDSVASAAEESGIALTPHTLKPVPRDGRRLSEADIAHAGMYNLGFIATGPASIRFLAWWHERLKTDAVVDLPNALFTDQRWIDWAPAIESPTILRDPGLNAAYWNLHERDIRRDEHGAWWASSARLRFFHFSGYDPARPWLLSKHLADNPRTLLSEHPQLAVLCDEYADELNEAGHTTLRLEPYRNDTAPNGLTLLPLVRAAYRAAYMSAADAAHEPPNPFSEADAFSDWLLSRPEPTRGETFSRLERAIWEHRADLRSAFPDPLGSDADRFRQWLDLDPGALEYLGRVGHQRPSIRRRSLPKPPKWGWSVAGYARAELGVGEACRRLALGVSNTGLPWEMIGVTDGPLSRQAHEYRGDLRSDPQYDNALLCVNADQTPFVSRALHLDRRGRRIGYWFWELEEFPNAYSESFDLLDEIWVSSEFNRRAIAAKTDKPVRVVPLPIPVPRNSTLLTRQDLGLPEGKKVFLTSLDFLSVMERKNPLGVISAYRSAFGPEDGAVLIVKSINGHLRRLERERVRAAIAGRPDIYLHEEYLTSFEMRSLIELSDVLVSLHRSEGYGLNLADAMAVGTPVIATAYSGNMDFMNAQVARLVKFQMCEVGPGCAPYAPTALWADPDLESASQSMRALFDSPALADELAVAAQEHIRDYAAEKVAVTLQPLLLGSLAIDLAEEATL